MRYTYFRFRPDQTLEVVVPRGRRVDAQEAIGAKMRWILREQETLAKTKQVLGDDHVMFGGSRLGIRFVESADEGLVYDRDAGEIIVRSSERRGTKEMVRRWFLRETSAYVVKKVSELAPLLGVKPSRVDVREIAQWGYCTRAHRLSFSWQLVALPENLREYVVLHELTHLVEFNHSRAFRSRLSALCPDFRQRERELDAVLPYDRKALM